MNILFICKYNVFRSKVAEALFNRDNKNPRLKAKSAGIFQGFENIGLNDTTKEVLKDKNIKLVSNRTNCLSLNLLSWYDLAIIVADDIPIEIMKYLPKQVLDNKPKKELRVWKISDVGNGGKEKTIKIVEEIEKRILDLLNEMR